MGANFPNAPTTGQVYQPPGCPSYRWDGEKWVALTAGGGSGIYVSDSPPVGAVDNSMWWESDTGMLYIRFNDGDSTQWVIAAPQPDISDVLRWNAQTLNLTQQVQARKNVYAAPFDAMSWNGIQINGNIEISQERGTTSTTAQGYILDGWYFWRGGTGVVSCNQVIISTMFPGYSAFLNASVTTAQASLAAGDFFMVQHYIEGYRFSRLAWGSSNAQPITIAFWTAHHRTGTYTGTIRHNDGSRAYAFSYTQNAADVPEYKTITIPGDTAGTWLTDNRNLVAVTFSMGSGTTYTAPSLNTWVAGNYHTGPGQINAVAATSDVFRLTGLVVLPGIEAPQAARAPFIARPYDQELWMCQRYLWRWNAAYGSRLGVSFTDQTVSTQTVIYLPNLQRAAPTVTWSNMTVSGIAVTNIVLNSTTAPASAASLMVYVASGLTTGSVQQIYAGSGGGWVQLDARL